MMTIAYSRRASWLFLSTVSVALFCVGCGESSETSDNATTASSASSGSGGAGGAGAGGAGQGGVGEGGAGEGGGVTGSNQLMDMWPVGPGDFWTFDVEMLGSGGVCGPGVHTMNVVAGPVVDGLESFGLTAWCNGAGSGSSPYTYEEGSGDLLNHFGGMWQLALANNIAEGAEFVAFNITYRWREEGTVTVPAGTFDNCWTAEQVGKVYYSTYCEGVGPVRHYYDEGGHGWDAKLTAKND